MNVKAWQICCFLAIIIGATIAVFPTEKDMLPLLIDNGRYQQAGAVIRSLIDDHKDDLKVVQQAIRLDLLEGLPDRASQRLEALSRQTSLGPARWRQLARLYEWQRQPEKARRAWEALLELEPRNPVVLERLIGYYRYAGDLTKESKAISHLAQRLGEIGQWRPDGSRLIDLIGAELNRLGHRTDSQSNDPLTAMLMEGLFQLYAKARDEVDSDNGAGQGEEEQDLMVRCLEQFVWTGNLETASDFAGNADQRWRTGFDQRMQLLEVLRWNQMNREALDLLTRLHDQHPDDPKVLTAMAEIAIIAGDKPAAIRTLEALANLEPGDPGHREQLMALYRQSGRTSAVFDYTRKRLEASGDAKLLPDLLALAMESGDAAMQLSALELAATIEVHDSAVLKQEADLWLILNLPEKAYPLLKRISMETPLTAEVMLTLLQVAGYTNDPAIIADALRTAEARMDSDPKVLDAVARAWLAAANPQNAYHTLRRLSEIRGNRPPDIHATLEMAGHTGDPTIVDEAVAWAIRLAPADPAVVDKSIALCLATGQTERAYHLEAGRVTRHRRDADVSDLIALAESTGRPALVADALRIGISIAPTDAQLVRRLARFYLAQGDEPRAIAAFERYLMMRPDDIATQLQLADLYEWQQQPQKALALYRRLAQAQPDQARYADALSRLMAATGDREGQLRLLMQASDRRPKDVERALAAGRALVAEGRLEKARFYLERAADAAPSRTDILAELADVYQWTGRQDRLIPLLERLEQSDRLTPGQATVLADAYLARKQSGDALRVLKRFEDHPPLPQREGLMLAGAYDAVGHPEAGRRILTQLFRENRNDPSFLADVGDHALWQSHTGLAMQIYTAVLKKEPHNPKALKGSGQIHAHNNDPSRAIRSLETYNRLYPDDYEGHYLLGEMYTAANRADAARNQFRLAMRLIDRAKTTDRKATAP